MKKYLTSCILLVLLFALSACSTGADYAGKYVCVSIGEGEDIPSGTYLQLDANGKGSFHVGLELDLVWAIEGETLTIQTKFIENTYEGTLKDGVLRLTIEGGAYVFVLEEQKEAYLAAQTTPLLPEETQQMPLDEAAVGRYVCTSIRKEGISVAVSGQWVELRDDGSATLYLGLSYPGSWYSVDGAITLTLNTGDVYTGKLSGDGLRLEGELMYVFSRNAEQTDTEQSGPICAGSSWTGTIKISNHKGNGVMQRGTFDIVAKIVERNDACYFEIYYADQTDEEAMICFPVKLHNNYLEPIVGGDAEQGWIFENRMTSSDVWSFTMFLRDGKLTADYDYANTYETAEIALSLFPEE